MEKSLEDRLYQAILMEDQDTITQLLSQGANPNKTVSHGKTCLGEAAYTGNNNVLKLLIEASKSHNTNKATHSCTARKRYIRSHKRKLKHDGQHHETVGKCKNPNDRAVKDYYIGQFESIESSKECSKQEKNQGYYVFIHSEGSSSDESKISSLRSPLSPPLLQSPQADLEWDEEIGNVAPTTSEDETWSSMYKWYAAILECTGAAIASASVVTNGIDQQDTFMRTALHYAAEQGHTATVKLLLDAGCKVDITAGDGLTPLHVAVVKNHMEIVKMLIVAGSNVNYKTHEKMTPLHFAASRGFIDVVKVLVNNGAYLEARDTNERTALYLAAGRGHADVVKYLISTGANVNGEEIHGYTPLCEAVWQRYEAVVDVLLSSGARITHSHKLLHNAIIQRQEGIVKMLASLGGGINLHNDNGDTPLLLAARLSQHKIAEILLQNGANVNACNSITGANALSIAVESIDCPEEFEELLLILLEYNIDMNSTALTGDTALNRALLLHKIKNTEDDEIIAQRMLDLAKKPNYLQDLVEEKGWARKRIIWTKLTDADLQDFPHLTWDELRQLTLGIYQLKQSQSYTQEHLNEEGLYSLYIHREDDSVLRVQLRSRHTGSKNYNIWIKTDRSNIAHIQWYCQCIVGARVVGYCAHVASVLWFLAYWRHQSIEVKRPSLEYANTLQDATAEGWSSSDSDEESQKED